MEVISHQGEGSLNLLGLIIREIFIKKGKEIKTEKNFSVGIKAGKMASTLIFKKNILEIRNGISEKPDCLIEGKLGTFIQLTSSNNPIIPLLKRELKIKGNPFAIFYFVRTIKKAIEKDGNK